MDLCDKLFGKADRYRRMSISIPGQTRDAAREHKEIMELAIARKSEEAVEALRRHYQNTADAVEKLFDADADFTPAP